MTEEKKASKTGWIIGGVAVVVIILLLLLLWPKNSYISDGGQVTKLTALTCTNSHPEGAFFKSEMAQRYTHEVRVTFKGDKLDDISYVFEATYNSPEAVESANATLHANYNIYMGENDQNQGMLEPTFANLKSKLKVSLYGDKSKLNDVTAKFFFLEPEEAKEIDKYDLNKLEKIYKGKGFSCIRSE